jgi:hypothetical protein
MAIFIVTKVRKELSSNGAHKHIEGVCTSDGTHYTRKKVVDSINEGNYWKTEAGGYGETIKTIGSCPKCSASPYIKTNPDSTGLDNLENLPSC